MNDSRSPAEYKGVRDAVGEDAVTFRHLEPREGGRLSEAIRVAYGESYDLPLWPTSATEPLRVLVFNRSLFETIP
jgi:hypothetical protein